MKTCGFIFLFSVYALVSGAQTTNCVFKPPQVIIDFGRGMVADPNLSNLSNYYRVRSACPSDGYYSFVSQTSGCFRGDWHTLSSDHSAGDAGGNMLVVNAAPEGGVFLSLPITGLKSNTMYELGMWVMNLCRPTDKCPYVLLPSLSVRLETSDGKRVANIVTRGLPRVPEPLWTQHRAFFTTPSAVTTLHLVMADNAPGGCGNDFALDDITFRECVKQVTPPVNTKKPAAVTKRASTPKPVAAKTPPLKKNAVPVVVRSGADSTSKKITAQQQPPKITVSAPRVLRNRENALVRKIETPPGEIRISLYDNGQIDGDTVSIYHNNKLIRSQMRLSEKPISISISVDASQPHHELIMVAENLGSIPPNTSVMVINTPVNRYEVFITSSEQKNAKVVFELRE